MAIKRDNQYPVSMYFQEEGNMGKMLKNRMEELKTLCKALEYDPSYSPADRKFIRVIITGDWNRANEMLKRHEKTPWR